MPDAAPEVVPVPVPTDPATPGSLFQNYDPQGAMGGLFAPAYIKGFAPSEQAVAAWQAQNRPVTAGMIDQTRMPVLWSPPVPKTLKDAPYSKGVPSVQSYLDPRGQVDVDALRAASQGGAYDMQARRDAIAARLALNTQLQAAGPPTPMPKGKAAAQETWDEWERRRAEILAQAQMNAYPGGY